jgi:NADP-reducing hydrogenase subunit HndB
MTKLTLDDLRKLRDQKKSELQKRDTSGKDIQVVIGMATCGIAAGARDTLRAFVDQIDQHKLTNVIIRQTGCMGLCSVEPTVEVMMPGMPTVIYGGVTAPVVEKIVKKHILGKTLVNDHIYDRPAGTL